MFVSESEGCLPRRQTSPFFSFLSHFLSAAVFTQSHLLFVSQIEVYFTFRLTLYVELVMHRKCSVNPAKAQLVDGEVKGIVLLLLVCHRK